MLEGLGFRGFGFRGSGVFKGYWRLEGLGVRLGGSLKGVIRESSFKGLYKVTIRVLGFWCLGVLGFWGLGVLGA